jgi:carbamoyl-phosphate synthase large subunit
VARCLNALGFALYATGGTAAYLDQAGVPVTAVNKVLEGRPHIVDMIKNGEVALIINTVEDRRSAIQDSYAIRQAALQGRVTYYTTVDGARAVCRGMERMNELEVYDLQGLHGELLATSRPRRTMRVEALRARAR